MISFRLLLGYTLALSWVSLSRHCQCSAFLTGPPTRRGHSGKIGSGNSNNGGRIPPPRAANRHDDWADDGFSDEVVASSFLQHNNETDDATTQQQQQIATNNMIMRGGSTKPPPKSSDHDRVLKGGKVTLASTASYWSDAFGKAGQAVTKPFKSAGQAVSSRLQSKEQKKEQELLDKLETTKVQSVVMVPNTTVVPNEVVQLAARRSGLIGNPLRTDRVQDFAASLKKWYQMRGYILHSVTGATLNTASATAEIQVQEPHVSRVPVDITFCKEMVVDPETGNILTFRQYKERHMKRKTFGHRSITKADTNTTFVQTTGKTRPSRIAQVLGLKPGAPFQWDASRWRSVSSSGIFARVLQAGPQRMQDGSVQLQILATEAPPRHLEYGVSKSLYTGSWEGEVDFQHENLLGGGESLALQVRRGTKDPEPSVTLRFSDDKFGMPGGYDVEAFSDFIGDTDAEGGTKKGKSKKSDNAEDSVEDETPPSKEPNKLLDRKGMRFTYRNPIETKRIRHSSASTSLERTATQSGIRETIGCGSLTLGPFRRELPLDARSSIDGRFTTGLRVPEGSVQAELSSDKNTEIRGGSTTYQGLTLLPFTSFRLTTTQVLPLLSSSYSASSAAEPEKQPSLALRHTVSGSTRNLPQHEQNAMGFSSMIRGGQSKGGISTYVTGATELRIPLNIMGGSKRIQNLQQDASVVLFGDWVSARKNNGSPFAFEKSIGVGFRKIAQGIPLKVDFCYAGNGKIKSNFGLGRDFDV
ncbi:expressed unknown protein [Seminavis robusta]|uniref:Bacterial surface antigen (D15) domain-containing protein n=1 Tax=Seminavis robusta TaxID=568900 RepID=A0A9N8DTS5_9STRA|nr:expressed unknown protein [Seminavis robusta]|eukprot:Sro351_g124060.1 n/a (755) ;mRNA; f:67047-69311